VVEAAADRLRMVLFSETAVSLVSSQALSFSTNGFVSACRAARRSSAPAAADPALDGIECAIRSNASWAIGAGPPLSMIEEVAPPVQPAESERHRASITPRISRLFVDRIAVALHDAGIAC
jgi:hypothetical protein